MPKAAKTRKYIKAKKRARPAGLVAKVGTQVDKRARFSEELKQQAVALARQGKVTREIGTELGLDKAQWQNIRLWTEKANVDLPKERLRGPNKGSKPKVARAAVHAAAGSTRKLKAPLGLAEPTDPIARILDMIENPTEAIAALESERAKAVQRMATIDKLLAVLRAGE